MQAKEYLSPTLLAELFDIGRTTFYDHHRPRLIDLAQTQPGLAVPHGNPDLGRYHFHIEMTRAYMAKVDPAAAERAGQRMSLVARGLSPRLADGPPVPWTPPAAPAASAGNTLLDAPAP